MEERSMFDMLELAPGTDLQINDRDTGLFDLVPVTSEFTTNITPRNKQLKQWFKDRHQKAIELQNALENELITAEDLSRGYPGMWMKYYRLRFEGGRICYVEPKGKSRVSHSKR